MKTKPTKSEITSRSDHKAAPTDDVAAGEKAFAAVETRLLALPGDGLDNIIVDVQIAALTALSVSRAVDADAALRARFEALARVKEFDLSKLDGLATTALAAWFARHMYLLASATHSEAQLPVSLATTAATVKARMMRVVEYHLGDHPVAGRIVAAIRPGTGYMDLANDLVALARLYRDYAPLLEHDRKDYKAADQALAAQTGDQILSLLKGSTPDQRTWGDRQARAWTLLNRDYAEVYAAGRYLKRHDSDVETVFPSLVAASRAAASKPTTNGQPTTSPAQGGGGASPPAGDASA